MRSLLPYQRSGHAGHEAKELKNVKDNKKIRKIKKNKHICSVIKNKEVNMLILNWDAATCNGKITATKVSTRFATNFYFTIKKITDVRIILTKKSF